MKIHEYQGKEILRKYNVAIPQGAVAYSVDEATAVAQRLGGVFGLLKLKFMPEEEVKGEASK